MSTTTSLAALKPGETATIAAVHTDQALSYRLAALGFRVGKRIEMVRTARFSGPLHVRIGATDVMLRRKDAQQIEVQTVFQ
jgi:Fe2+ transport system protein FeoA